MVKFILGLGSASLLMVLVVVSLLSQKEGGLGGVFRNTESVGPFAGPVTSTAFVASTTSTLPNIDMTAGGNIFSSSTYGMTFLTTSSVAGAGNSITFNADDGTGASAAGGSVNVILGGGNQALGGSFALWSRQGGSLYNFGNFTAAAANSASMGSTLGSQQLWWDWGYQSGANWFPNVRIVKNTSAVNYLLFTPGISGVAPSVTASSTAGGTVPLALFGTQAGVGVNTSTPKGVFHVGGVPNSTSTAWVGDLNRAGLICMGTVPGGTCFYFNGVTMVAFATSTY